MRVHRRRLVAVGAGIALVGATFVAAAPAAEAAAATTTTTTITVYAGGGSNDLGNVFTAILGANHRYTFNAYGTWDPSTGQVNPDVVEKARRMGVKLVRWPGGTVANTVWWQGTIGTNRMCQRDGRIGDLGDVGDPANPADDVMPARDGSYGLDEHRAFVAAIGAQSQIMVPMAISNPIDAADLVEYLNTPQGTGSIPTAAPTGPRSGRRTATSTGAGSQARFLLSQLARFARLVDPYAISSAVGFSPDSAVLEAFDDFVRPMDACGIRLRRVVDVAHIHGRGLAV